MIFSKFVGLALFALLALPACKKPAETAAPDKPYQLMADSVPAFTYYTLGTDITEADLLATPDDSAYQQFNYVDYALTLSLLELYRHHSGLFSDLIQEMRANPGQACNLLDFARDYPRADALYDSVFASRFSDFAAYGNDWKSFIAANYKYDTAYVPFARFANLGSIDFDLPAYVAGPFEINEDKFPDFDDDMPMWIHNGTNLLLTTIDESLANTLTNPVVVTTNDFVGFEQVPPLPPPPPPVYQTTSCGNPIPPHVHEKISHTWFKINNRYEGRGRSEYRVVFGASETYVQSANAWAGCPPILVEKTKKVKKNEIGTLINWDFDVFYPDFYHNPLCVDINMLSLSHAYDTHFIIAAFEYDWINSRKDLFKLDDQYGNPHEWRTRRKFASEWYFFDPDANNGYDFMNRNPTPNSEYVNYTKGELHLLRHY